MTSLLDRADRRREVALFVSLVVGVLAAEFGGVFLLLRYALEHWPCR